MQIGVSKEGEWERDAFTLCQAIRFLRCHWVRRMMFAVEPFHYIQRLGRKVWTLGYIYVMCVDVLLVQIQDAIYLGTGRDLEDSRQCACQWSSSLGRGTRWYSGWRGWTIHTKLPCCSFPIRSLLVDVEWSWPVHRIIPWIRFKPLGLEQHAWCLKVFAFRFLAKMGNRWEGYKIRIYIDGYLVVTPMTFSKSKCSTQHSRQAIGMEPELWHWLQLKPFVSAAWTSNSQRSRTLCRIGEGISRSKADDVMPIQVGSSAFQSTVDTQ